jgi:uncharacterized oligopeptide transporter (OPT) family protein
LLLLPLLLQGNGIIVGLAICGVMFATTSSAATLMGDFRTGYITLTAPRAMFVAQLVGQLLGAILAPVAFMLFWGTGQVSVTACASFRFFLKAVYAFVGEAGVGHAHQACR